MNGEHDGPVEFHYKVPSAQRVGVYANTARISYSPYEFTLDWAVATPEPDDSEDASRVAIVCSRVRIPVSLIFSVLQGINRAMTFYEADYGEIRRPGT